MEWTPLHAHLHQVIRSRLLLKRQQRILIAVSGGQDSLCLCKLMLDLQPKWGWELAIIHCDHRWRDDSQENAKHVQNIAQGWQLPCYLETTTTDLANEAIARDWRYQVFSQIAIKYGYECVLTGHTQSDRAETLLYNLLRGSGADGLQALTWCRQLTPQVRLVRPMLTVSRSQTGDFCTQMNLPVWEDTTNMDVKYARNRIRHELLPYLQDKFNPHVEVALARTAEILQGDVECWEIQAELDLQQALEPENPQTQTDTQTDIQTNQAEYNAPSLDPQQIQWKINRQQLKTLHISRQRRVMRRFLQQSLGISANFDQIIKITALITAPSRSQTDPFPGGAIARVEGKWIILDFPTHSTVPQK